MTRRAACVKLPLMLTHARQMLLIGLSLFFVLAGCKPPTPPPSPTPRPTAVPAVVTVFAPPTPTSVTPQPQPTIKTPATTITLEASLPEAQTQALQDDIQAFQRQFPQYVVQLQQYDSPENFMSRLTAGESNFDVALVSPVLLGHLYAARQLTPVTNFFPSSFINDFAGVTLLGATRDNQLWGLADTAGFHLMLFYNRDLVDTPPQTTAELSTLAQQLTDAPHWGLAVNSYDPLWLVPWLPAYGGWLTDDAGRPTLNTPSMDAAITLYLSWQGRLTGIAPVITYDEARHRFLSGDVAMMIDGDWALTELARANKVNWGVALLPQVGETGASQPAAPLVLGRYWVVNAAVSGDRVPAAVAFLDFITRPERQLAWTARFGLLPTRRAALNDAAIMNDPILRTSAAQMQAGRAVPAGVNADTLLNAMREPLRGVIDGELTPRQAAEMMQANVEK